MTTLTLNDPPTDIISRTLFADNASLLVSSWDKTISLYNTDTNTRTYSINTEAPILDCAFYLVSYSRCCVGREREPLGLRGTGEEGSLP